MSPPTERTGPREETRPATPSIQSITAAEWSEAYTCARRWVAWSARRRWPDYACNDEVWAMSVAAWWHNGAVVRRG